MSWLKPSIILYLDSMYLLTIICINFWWKTIPNIPKPTIVITAPSKFNRKLNFHWIKIFHFVCECEERTGLASCGEMWLVRQGSGEMGRSLRGKFELRSRLSTSIRWSRTFEGLAACITISSVSTLSQHNKRSKLKREFFYKSWSYVGYPC